MKRTLGMTVYNGFYHPNKLVLIFKFFSCALQTFRYREHINTLATILIVL
jgi:hypothetical protein